MLGNNRDHIVCCVREHGSRRGIVPSRISTICVHPMTSFPIAMLAVRERHTSFRELIVIGWVMSHGDTRLHATALFSKFNNGIECVPFPEMTNFV
jgi:hypothetical protein